MQTIGEGLKQWLDDFYRHEAYQRERDQERKERMGRYATEGGGGSDFKPAPAGTHLARAFRLIDLGTHHGEWQGAPTVRNQVFIGWELPDELDSFGDKMQPYTVGRFFTNSLSEKSNLRPLLESWRGKAFSVEELMKFDLETIVGQPCMLTVVHEQKDGKTKAKVVSAAKLPKNMTAPPQINPSQVFWIDEWNSATFEQLPEGFQKIIKESDEYKQRMMPARNGNAPPIDDDDSIPF